MPTAKRKSAETYRRDTVKRELAAVKGGASAHARYHAAQADPTRDTAAKRLRRRGGWDTVTCPCGAEFPAAVRGS